MPNLEKSYRWAVNTCNAKNVGYSQTYRNQQTVNGITYYDCSSFIWYALKNGGFTMPTSYPFTTGEIATQLPKIGFTKVDKSGEWKKGDIALQKGHVEMVYSGGIGYGVCMGAHNNKVKLENQVSIGGSNGNPSVTTKASSILSLWRYQDGVVSDDVTTTYSWIQGGTSEYFSEDKQQNNACCIYQFFFAKGWTLQAIAALCGNVQQESTFNPNLIEIGGTGHGLVQWTPSKASDPNPLFVVLDAIYGGHSDWEDGDKQCNAIYAEFEQATGLKNWGIEKQWYSTSSYPMSWSEWASSTEDAGDLALAFQANYERPASLHSERAEYARNWYDFLLTIDPYGYNPTKQKRGLKVWQMIRYHL